MKPKEPIPLRVKTSELTKDGYLTKEVFERAMLREGKKKGYTDIKFDYTQFSTLLSFRTEDTELGKVELFILTIRFDKELDRMIILKK